MPDDLFYLSARAAAARLNVTLPTLYAYVSRGLIRSEPGEGMSRARRYHAADVQRLVEHKTLRHDPALAAAQALNWGLPILDSSLTLIADGHLWYRGRDSTTLARNTAFEEVVALLWTGSAADAAELFAQPWLPIGEMVAHLAHFSAHLTPMQRMTIALTLAPPHDLAALTRAHIPQTGAHILHLLTAVVTLATAAIQPIAVQLQRAWCPEVPRATELLNAALILCADHEMNASAFAARVVASADAHLYQVVTAGLAALQGLRHGGNTALVMAMLRAIAIPTNARSVIAARLGRGEGIPGFGHQLYPEGDPRAAALLDQLHQVMPAASVLALIDAVVAVGREVTAHQPNIDLALAALALALELPEDAPLTIFALGRTAGWIAHAIEQYAHGQLLRPRARYVGLLPDISPA